MKIPQIRRQVTSKSGGSTRYNIGQSSLSEVLIPFLSMIEQEEIAKILPITDNKLDTLREKKFRYEYLKKGLMQKLLTGEIRVTI